MSYSIQRTNGTVAATVNDGEYDNTSTSLTLVGQNFVGYGEFLQSNMVKIMENFANSQAPAHASIGQLWFNTTSKKIAVRTSASPETWKTLGTVTASPTAPVSGNALGDLWFDTVNAQFYANTGSTWSLVGPSFTSTQGITGAFAVDVIDQNNDPHTSIAFKVDNTVAAIWNSETEFATDGSIPGFTTLNSGLNINNIYTGTTFHGQANSAVYLQGYTPASFLLKNANETTTGNLGIKNDNGLYIGNNYNLQITVDPLSKDVTIYNNQVSGEFFLRGRNVSGPIDLLTSDVNTGLLMVAGDPEDSLGIATKNYVDDTVADLNLAQTASLTSNVNAINGTLGVLTGEINDVNVYAQNLNTIKANLASPALTGTPTAPTASAGDNTIQIANTAWVTNELNLVLNGVNANVDGINTTLGGYAPLASPALSGTPTAPTAIPATNTTQIATTAFVTAAVQNLNSSSTSSIATKSNIASPTFTGAPKAPTAVVTTANTQIATTAFVHSVLPTGIILMWSGSAATIPTGWALCNGSNGTPNLTDRFIIGAGATYTPGSSGGGNAASAVTDIGGSHTHGGQTGGTALTINQLPAHGHLFDDIRWSEVSGSYSYNDPQLGVISVGPGAGSNKGTDYDNGAHFIQHGTYNTGSGQAHSHSIDSHSGHAHTISVQAMLPAYYALCYIMKTS